MRCAHVWKPRFWTEGRRCQAHALRIKDPDGKRRCFAHSKRMKKARKKAAQSRLKRRIGEDGMKQAVKRTRNLEKENQKLYGKRKCPRCGAKPKQRCQTRRSMMRYPWTYVHLERKYPS
jgi:hypothetical protein